MAERLLLPLFLPPKIVKGFVVGVMRNLVFGILDLEMSSTRSSSCLLRAGLHEPTLVAPLSPSPVKVLTFPTPPVFFCLRSLLQRAASRTALTSGVIGSGAVDTPPSTRIAGGFATAARMSHINSRVSDRKTR